MERKLINVKLTDTICNTTIKQRIRMTDVAECVTNAQFTCSEHNIQVNDNKKTFGSKEYHMEMAKGQFEDQNVAGYWHRQGQQRQRMYKDCGRGLLPVVEGCSLEWNRAVTDKQLGFYIWKLIWKKKQLWSTSNQHVHACPDWQWLIWKFSGYWVNVNMPNLEYIIS